MRMGIAATFAAVLCLGGATPSAPASDTASGAATSSAPSAATSGAAAQGVAVSPPAPSCGGEPPSAGAPTEGAGAGTGSQTSVLRPDQVISILDHTVLWYRTLGTQQQFADQPSDQLILFADRQIADQVVALVFQIARADAELYASQVSDKTAADAASSPQTLTKMRSAARGSRSAAGAHRGAQESSGPSRLRQDPQDFGGARS
jgi:hypothetical protein